MKSPRGARGRGQSRVCLACSRLEESIDRLGRTYWWCERAGKMTYAEAAARPSCERFEAGWECSPAVRSRRARAGRREA